MFYLVLFCYYILQSFSPFSIAITSLGEERANLSVFFVCLFDLRMCGFVCFVFLLVAGLRHSLDFSLIFYANHLLEWRNRLEDIFKLNEKGNLPVSQLVINKCIYSFTAHI